MRNLGYIALIVGTSVFLPACASGQGLGSDGRVKVLAIGEVLPTECPLAMWFNDEPAIAYTLVVTRGLFIAVSLEDKKRFVRLYMPRTMEKLISYKVLLLPDPCLDVMSDIQLSMMVKGVEEEGMGAFVPMGGKVLSDLGTFQQFANSDLSRILPHDFSSEPWRRGGPFTIRINDDPSLPPVLCMFKSLGLEKVPGVDWGLLIPKEPGAARIWAWVNTDQFAEDVIWMMSWDFGKGETWTTADDIDHLWWSSIMHGPTANRYSRDVMCNVVFESAGRRLPDDIAVVYKLRQDFREYSQKRSFLQSLIDLLEGFGANMEKAQSHLGEVDSVFDEARSKYVSQDFEGATEDMSRASAEICAISEESGKIQRRALFWVYLVEWLVVSGTLAISGSVLYVFMIGRRMYREVSLTKRTV